MAGKKEKAYYEYIAIYSELYQRYVAKEKSEIWIQKVKKRAEKG